MRVLVTCKDCKKDRLVETNGMLKASYEKRSPRCHKCGFNEKLSSRTWFTSESTKGNKNRLGSIPWNKRMENGYDAVHDWIEKKLGKPRVCWNCETVKSKVYQWSNVSGEYKRELSDWQRLCVKCHCRYDFEKFGAREAFYT